MYNIPSSEYNIREYRDILEKINQKVQLEKYDGPYLVFVKEVENAVRKLTQDKKDGATTGLMSNCFLEAPPELFFHISRLFSIILKYGYMPEGILSSSIVPIVNDATA